MAYQDIIGRLRGVAAKLPSSYAGTLANNGLQAIYDESTWSFMLQSGAWLTPGLAGGGSGVSPGTITTTIGSPTVVGNATAATLWASLTNPTVTSYQIRLSQYSLYNIVAFTGGTTLTLDRPWMEPASGAGLSYMLYQAYFVTPPRFKRFLAIQDFTNANWLNFTRYKQSDLAVLDPQRTIFDLPTYVVPLSTDQRAGSATLGQMLYELWPGPLSVLPYYLYMVVDGPLMVLPSDDPPYPITNELVQLKAEVRAYEWLEAQKGAEYQRGSGADTKFLLGVAEKLYQQRLLPIKKRDRDLCDNFISKIRRQWTPNGPGNGFYSAITGQGTV